MNPILLGELAFLTPLLARAGNTRLFADDLCRWRVRECQRSSEICFSAGSWSRENAVDQKASRRA
jgi:hypothetical protein